MKSYTSLLIFLLITTLRSEAKKIEGIIITQTDTMHVLFHIPVRLLLNEPNYERLQQGIRYFDENGEKVMVRPDFVSEIQFRFEDEVIRMPSLPNTLTDAGYFAARDYIFLRLETDGYLKVYTYYFTSYNSVNAGMPGSPAGGGTFNKNTVLLLQKGNSSLKAPGHFSFRKDMMDYFADCPALAGLIEKRELRRIDLESIVSYYNTHCR